MKTESVKETLKDVHHEQHTKGNSSKDTKAKVGRDEVNVESRKHRLLPKHSGKLRMGKRKGPQTEVRSRVGNHTKNKLNSLNSLMNDNLAKTVLFMVVLFTAVVLFVFVGVLNGLMSSAPSGEKVGLGKEKNGHRSKGDNEKNVLDFSLSVVEGLVNVAGLKCNVNKSRNKVGWLATVTAATVVEGALGSGIVVSGTRVSPRSTGTIYGKDKEDK